MARQKIKIKKIDNATARQVTFSKRRRGIFKKAEELSILCDAEVGLVIFSTTGKLYEYASSNMKDIITRYGQQSHHITKLDKPLQVQVEKNMPAELNKEVADRTQQLRGMKSEDFEGLNLEGLQQLEKSLESGLKRVIEMKEIMLEEENKHLKQKWLAFSQMAMLSMGKSPIFGDSDITMQENVSAESMNNVSSCNSGPSLEDDSSDTSLKLGLPFPN
ncbi:MADS-box protein SVP isoform X3 [Medicago truncatula]|uniref:MADS-box protein SVP isoform X3 n=1 Tax=Medicago truncatula TaxID=3880 RepID=UPI0019688EDF|nr:MADS-box protein SVP isoform X3 [Medicago truncatula]